MEYLTQAQEGKADLVIASYSLSELTDEASRNATVRLLWNNVAKGGILVSYEFHDSLLMSLSVLLSLEHL